MDDVSELRASRKRVLAAGDAERRRIERGLHDNVQQHLVALDFQVELHFRPVRRDERIDRGAPGGRVRERGQEALRRDGSRQDVRRQIQLGVAGLEGGRRVPAQVQAR